IERSLADAKLTFNQFIALYVYLVREISQIKMSPEIKELMTQALASEDPEELLVKLMDNIQNPNMEQSIEILYHLVHIALGVNMVGFLSSHSDELSTFLGENLTDYFAKIFQFEGKAKLAKLLTNAISQSHSSAFGDSFVEVFGESLIKRKLEKAAMLKDHEAVAAGQFYEMNERLVSAKQRLHNLQMLPVKKKRQEKENSRLIGQVSSEVDDLHKAVLLKQRKFETLAQYHQAASSSVGYLMIPADASSSIPPIKIRP
ncbi:MAG TPA: hypothetical protein PLD88_12010, partial [Candidatus Berkiella sp.]|nr:hypothetical protein [Candidatus Berkiella sp.]